MSTVGLLPLNATDQEQALDLAVSRLGDVPVPIKDLWSPKTCPVAILPWLAWALGIETWDNGWAEWQKRQTVAAAIEVHRRKGTVGALKRALQALGYEVTIDEATGTPYTFRLRVDATQAGVVSDVYAEAESIALRTKNVRSHLLGVDALSRRQMKLYIKSGHVDGVFTTILPALTSSMTGSGTSNFVGGGVFHDMEITIGL